LVIIGAGIIVSASVNYWLKALVCRQLDQNIAQTDSIQIRYGDVKIRAFIGKAYFKDFYFCSDTLDWDDCIRPVSEARVDMLSLDGINYFDWLVRRKLHLKGFTITNPSFRTKFVNNKKQETGSLLQQQIEEERREKLENMMKIARIFVDDAVVDHITIDHAKIRAESLDDSLFVYAPDCMIKIYDLGYNIKDQIPHYNDSVFHFMFHDIEARIPKVATSVWVHELMAEPNGVLHVTDIRIKSSINKQNTETILAGVNNVSVGGFDVAKFNAIKQMNVRDIHLYNPFISMQIDENIQPNKRTKPKSEMDVINQKMLASNIEIVKEFITGLTVDTVAIHDAMIDLKSISTNFTLHANDISTNVYGVGYSLINEIPYHYNDSVYKFSVGHVEVITPDSAIYVSANNVHYDNGGAFAIGKTHICNIIDRWELAHLAGDIPTTWVDMYVDTLYTSNKNIVKEALTLEKSFLLDTLYVRVNKMSIFRDLRWKAKQPYKLPQTFLLDVKYPFIVKNVLASVKNMHIETALTRQNVGKMNLGPLRLRINNVTAIRNSTIHAVADGQMGKSTIHANFDMKVNRSCDWHLKLNAQNINMHYLDDMIYPMVGMKIGCDVQQLTADYGGDTAKAQGTLCMVYDNLDVFADKNSNSPFTIIQDMSGFINSASKTLLHKSNPSKPGQKPITYQVEWKNDPWNDPSLYYIGPIIDGCIKNLLPGLFLHKRVKEEKAVSPMK